MVAYTMTIVTTERTTMAMAMAYKLTVPFFIRAGRYYCGSGCFC